MTERSRRNVRIACPFIVAIDSAETQPFTFGGMLADADKEFCEYEVRHAWISLGRYPNSYGDYSIIGLEREVAVERKSLDDVWGTVLGWETDFQKENQLASRRERFESELANLSTLPAACVVVEADWGTALNDMPEWGEKPAETNRKIFFRSIISFQQRFGVPWNFMGGRRMAEAFTFRWLERHWKKLPKERRNEIEGYYGSLAACSAPDWTDDRDEAEFPRRD